MKISIKVSSSFTASHRHDKTLSEGLHGHNFKYAVYISGDLNEEGYIVDFREVEKELKKIDGLFEGKTLNGLMREPTTENVASFIFKKLSRVYPALEKVEVSERENYAAICEK